MGIGASIIFRFLREIDWNSLTVRRKGCVLKLYPKLQVVGFKDFEIGVDVLEFITVFAMFQLPVLTRYAPDAETPAAPGGEPTV